MPGAVRGMAALALAGLALTGCGDDEPSSDYGARVAEACPGTTTGAQALEAIGVGSGDGVVARVKRAERTATRAAKALGDATPPQRLDEAHAEAVHVLLGQAGRLRLVRDQIDRGSPPRTVLEAASAGLTAGDRQAASRLAALGVRSC